MQRVSIEIFPFQSGVDRFQLDILVRFISFISILWSHPIIEMEWTIYSRVFVRINGRFG